jgi:hypothetical protein
MNSNEPQIPAWLAPHVAEVESWGPVAMVANECWVDGCARHSERSRLCHTRFRRARRAWHPSPSEGDRARKPEHVRPTVPRRNHPMTAPLVAFSRDGGSEPRHGA